MLAAERKVVLETEATGLRPCRLLRALIADKFGEVVSVGNDLPGTLSFTARTGSLAGYCHWSRAT